MMLDYVNSAGRDVPCQPVIAVFHFKKQGVSQSVKKMQLVKKKSCPGRETTSEVNRLTSIDKMPLMLLQTELFNMSYI